MADKKNGSKEIEAAWIRELAGILDETGLTEIEVEKGNVRLRVSRAAAGAAPVQAVAAAAPAPAPQPTAAPAEPSAPVRRISLAQFLRRWLVRCIWRHHPALTLLSVSAIRCPKARP